MTYYAHILLFCILTLTGCSTESKNSLPYTIKAEWHLINVSGGIAGVNHDFELNTIVWIFDEESSMLTITNNNESETKADGLDSGVYNFSITEQDSKTFLFVDGTEFGNFSIDDGKNEMVIDQNVKVSGQGADGYIYTFKRVAIYEE